MLLHGGHSWLAHGVICVVNSVNERDLNLLTNYTILEWWPTSLGAYTNRPSEPIPLADS